MKLLRSLIIYNKDVSRVVPAKAGTHNHGRQLLESRLPPSAKSHRHGVWVPAFAGTTHEASSLVECADQVLDLLGVRPELLGELVEIGVGNRDEAGLVDVGDDLHADRLQLYLRLVLELDRP